MQDSSRGLAQPAARAGESAQRFDRARPLAPRFGQHDKEKLRGGERVAEGVVAIAHFDVELGEPVLQLARLAPCEKGWREAGEIEPAVARAKAVPPQNLRVERRVKAD